MATGEKIEANATEAQKLAEQISESFKARAEQLEKAGLAPDQVPPQDMQDDPEAKAIADYIEKYAQAIADLDKIESDYEDDLYDSLDEDSLDQLLNELDTDHEGEDSQSADDSQSSDTPQTDNEEE